MPRLSELAKDGLPAVVFRCPLCGEEELRLSAKVAVEIEVELTKRFVLISAEHPELRTGDRVEEDVTELSAFCWACGHDFGEVQRAEDGDIILTVDQG